MPKLHFDFPGKVLSENPRTISLGRALPIHPILQQLFHRSGRKIRALAGNSQGLLEDTTMPPIRKRWI